MELDNKEFTPKEYGDAMNIPRYKVNPKFTPYYELWKWVLKMSEKRKIIELGCGTGQFARLAFDMNYPYIMGVDISEKNIEACKKMNPAYEYRFAEKDIRYLHFTPADDYVLVCLEVLEHIKDDVFVVQQMSEWEQIIFSVPNFDTKSHVRLFRNVEEIEDRYGEFLIIDEIKEFPNKDNKKIIMFGVVAHGNNTN